MECTACPVGHHFTHVMSRKRGSACAVWLSTTGACALHCICPTAGAIIYISPVRKPCATGTQQPLCAQDIAERGWGLRSATHMLLSAFTSNPQCGSA